MKYLDCITMLNHALTVLQAEQRVQVPKGKMDELVLTLNLVNHNMEPKSTEFKMTMDDLMGGAISIKDMPGIMYLSDTMKQTLLGGINTLKSIVASEAFKYYSENDFDPTPEVIPIMRDVVQTYSDGGGVI